MESLRQNVTQSQQITHHLHYSNVFNVVSQQKPHSIYNSCNSPTSLYPQLLHKSHNPQIKSLFQSNVSIQNKQTLQPSNTAVSDRFEQQFLAYNHHQKISCLLDIIKIYRKLISDHGLFLLTKDHLKMDCIGRAMVFMSPDINATEPSLPLTSNKYHELKAVQQLIDLFRKYFSKLFFKYSKIRNLQELENFFIFVKKRNQIHKRCKHIVRELSRSKIRTSISNHSVSPDISSSKRFDLQQRPASHFGTYQPKSYMSISMSSKHVPSAFERRGGQSLEEQRKSQLDTTSSILRQNKSYLEGHNIEKRTEANRKSCFLKTTYEDSFLGSFAKNTSMTSKNKQARDDFTKFLQKENKKGPKTQAKKKDECKKQMKNQEEIVLQNLFLSEIVQDCQSEVLNSGGGNGGSESLSQFFKDFENVFY